MNAWRHALEVRTRFVALAVLVVLAAATIGLAVADHAQATLATMAPGAQPAYRIARITSEWFENAGPSALLILAAIFLSTGGPATAHGSGATFITLALPVSRTRLLVAQLGAVLAMVVLLAFAGAAAAVVAGATRGAHYPVVPAVAAALLQSCSVAPLAGATLLLQTLTRRATASGVTIFGLVLIGPALLADLLPSSAMQRWLDRMDFPPMIEFPRTPPLHDLNAAGLFAAAPWGAIAAATLATLLFAAFAALVFERSEP